MEISESGFGGNPAHGLALICVVSPGKNHDIRGTWATNERVGLDREDWLFLMAAMVHDNLGFRGFHGEELEPGLEFMLDRGGRRTRNSSTKLRQNQCASGESVVTTVMNFGSTA